MPRAPRFAHGSRSRLNARALPRFPSESLFDRLARAVCAADCLPRKELYEAWEVARRARRHFRGGRVLDLAAGHGLLAYALLLLDDGSPEAICVDARRPSSAARLAAALEERWPRLRGRVRYEERRLEESLALPGDLVVSAHACGTLTDRVLDAALAARARVAVLPCCQEVATRDPLGLKGWLDGPLAVDVARAARLAAAGYRVRTQTIPAEVTPKNRLLLGDPCQEPHGE
jgi:hypothetical protein